MAVTTRLAGPSRSGELYLIVVDQIAGLASLPATWLNRRYQQIASGTGDAIVLRWWASGLRFGDVAVTSHLRNTQVLAVYDHFLGRALLFTLAAGVVVGRS